MLCAYLALAAAFRDLQMNLLTTQDSRIYYKLRRFGPVVAAVVATTLSFILFFIIRQWERRDLQTGLQAIAQQRLELLRESIGESLESLHSLGSFYETGLPVDRAHFRQFVSDTLARRREIQALSWTPKVPASERAAYEAAARDDGFPDFQFTERDPASGHMVRARTQAGFYYPVYYIEPLDHNRAAFGFDLNARIETLSLARDQAGAVATPLIRLMQEKANEPGFIVYLPLYRGLTPPVTMEARRAANTGFVAAVFRLADLVSPALARLPGMRVVLRDSGRSSPDTAYALPTADESPPWHELAPYTLALPVAGREWQVTFTPTTAFLAGRRPWQSWAVLFGGLLATTLLTGYLLADLRRDAAIACANDALQSEVIERKRAEEAAASANRAKTDFLTSLSHEIRTPLNSILGYTQILERDPELPRRHRDAVGALGNSGHHLLGLLNSILDLSKIEAGRMEIQRNIFDLPALVHSLADMFKPRCAEKRLPFRVVCPSAGQRPVFGDEGKLRQILINLIGNAIKFTPRGEVFIGVRPAGGDQWLFEVIDTGIGFSDQERAGLFTPFNQTAAGRRSGGTGLGLAIALRQVELMGGKLDVQSEPGTGTRFFFTLPLPAAAALPASLGATPLPHFAAGVTVRALVVDDNRDNRHILARLLADIGCVVAEAGDTARALDIARQAPPDILFIDVLLGDTTGPELLAALRTDGLPASTPVLFHTAVLLERAQRDALCASGADLLAKPFRAEDLCTCLRRLPGVRFEEPAIAAAAAETPLPNLDLVVLPEDLCARMTVAAELHSTTVLKACLEELRQLGGPAEALADHFRQLLRAYDLAAIALLLSRVHVQPAESSTS
jgi:signal transduction histidine kinase/CheY-like chemotaxis protein